jgi:hypothetical protein
MANITISDELLERVEQSLPKATSVAEFVADAVREKLAWQQRKAEFFRLSDETRRQMEMRGISEAEILGEFEAFREGLTHD